MMKPARFDLEQQKEEEPENPRGTARAWVIVGILVLVGVVTVVEAQKRSRQPQIGAQLNTRIKSRRSGSGIVAKPNIMGGSQGTIDQFPYMVALIYIPHDKYYCTGVAVSANSIVVPAHCISVVPSMSDVKVVAGATDLTTYGPNAQVRMVGGDMTHEDFNPSTMNNDLGMVYLRSPLALNAYTQVANLPSDGETFSGSGTVVGWGDKTHSTLTVHSVDVPLITSSSCNQKYGGMITGNMMCAGTDGKGTCAGDAGAPLVMDKPGKKVVVGLTSWGHGTCESAQFPTVYTSLSANIPWIDSNKW